MDRQLFNPSKTNHCNWGTLSDPKSMNYGVPLYLVQPFFLIYINDLPGKLHIFALILYADDTNFVWESTNFNGVIPHANKELKLIGRWCNKNKLTVNL